MSFFKDFKDDLSQAVNELMPEENAPASDAPQMVDTITEPKQPIGQDDIADMLKNLDMGEAASAPAAEPMFEETVKAAEPVATEAPAPAPAPVEIPVYTEPVAAEPVAEPVAPAPAPVAVEPVFAPEPAPAPVVKEPVAPVFAPEVKEPEVKEVVTPVFTPEPAPAPVVKEPVTPVFDPASITPSPTINTMAEGVDEVGVIPNGMTVVGNISSNGSLDIMGTVKGDIVVAGKLNITGNLEGNAKADEVFADGARIIGEVVSNGTIKVGQSSVIKGNLTASSAVLAGAVKGDIDVKGPVILDSTAIIMGNIKSKSIQINNGAAIEGLCSQCYAEVSPSSFFTEG